MSKINFKSWLDKKLDKILPNTDIEKTTNEDLVEIISKDRDFTKFKFDKMEKRKLSEMVEQEAEIKVKRLKVDQKEDLDENLFKSVVAKFPVSVELKNINDVTNSLHKKLDQTLLKYDETLGGVILSFKNLKIVSKTGNISYNPTDPHISLTVSVEFIIFSPRPGLMLSGQVTHLEKDYISLIVFGIFHARISRKSDSKKIKVNDTLEFKVLRVEQTNDKFIQIEGTISK